MFAPSQSVRPSFCLSFRHMPSVYLMSESHRNFIFGGDMTLDTSNRESKFEVKRSKVKVTWNENAKIVFFSLTIKLTIIGIEFTAV